MFTESWIVIILVAYVHKIESITLADDQICAYTFNIPATDCEVAPTINRQLNFLETIVLNQQSQLQLLTDRINEIENPESHEEIETQEAGVGSTYVRWGRTECPDTAQLVYKGYAGKSHYTHSGGGVDYQCLPDDPEFPDTATINHQSKAYIYGVEYEDNSDSWSGVHDNDVPCAVCNVNGRGRQLMIPAKRSCPDDWTLEYSGLLATQHHSQQAATYVCVDLQMEAVNGGTTNQNGGLLYVVEAVCGSLKCPPYVNGKEIACTVCTL